MKRRTAIGLATLALGLAAPAVAQTWSELGPAPITSGDVGRVSAIVCSPTNANKYFAAGADGGVWRTTDGGATWAPLTDNMPVSAIGALALDPSNENVIYAGTGEANFANHSRYGLGIYKSTDGGNTWTHLAQSTFAGRCISKIVVSSSNPLRVYASVTRAGGFPEMAAAKGHPQRTGPLGVFRSTDGGVTWSHLTTGIAANTATDLVIDPSNSQILYAAIGHIFGSGDNGVYKSTNGGDTWSKLGGGFPTGIGRIALAISPSQPSRLFALVANTSSSSGAGATTNGFYTTSNAGTTWTSISFSSIQSTYGWYLNVVSVNPSDPLHAFFGGLDMVRVRVNGPVEFITPPHVDCHAIAWDASGRLLVGDDGGVHRSTNLGTSWAAINNNLGTVQFYPGLSISPTSEPFAFGGTQDNGTNRRNTNTKSWTRLVGGDGGWTQTDQANPLRMFAESQGTANLVRSTNGGGSFSDIGGDIDPSDRNCFLPPYLIDPTNSQRMYYATHRIWRSINGGTDWTAISADLTGGGGAAIRALAMGTNNPNYIYAATNDGRVQVSTNGGTSFTLRLTGLSNYPRVTRELFVDPSDAATAYLAAALFGTTQIRRTTNGGQTWEVLDGDLPDIPVNALAADVRCPIPVLYAGTDAGLYRSIDDGQTWRRYGDGLPNASVIDILLDIPRSRLVVGTMGRGAWTAPLRFVADYNNDGFVDGIDYDQFVNDFEAGNPAADFNGDGFVDGIDYDQFMAAFEAGC